MTDVLVNGEHNFSAGQNRAVFPLGECTNMTSPRVHKDVIDYTILGVIVSTTLTGVVGNILVCAVLQKFSKKFPMDWYIFVLAIADLGILLIDVPLILIRIQMDGEWPLGKIACQVFYPTQDLYYGVSIWSIVIIAMERHRSIVSLANGFKRRSMRSSRLIALTLWMLNFFIFSLPLFFFMEYVQNCGRTYCLVSWPKWADLTGQANALLQIHTYAIVLLGYIIPLGIIVWSYAAISKHLERSNAFLEEESESSIPAQHRRSSNLRIRQNIRAKRLLTPVVIVFAMTMLPLNILRFVVLYMYIPVPYFRFIFPVACFLVSTNSVVNPIIYSIASERFRKGLKDIFKRGAVSRKHGVFVYNVSHTSKQTDLVEDHTRL